MLIRKYYVFMKFKENEKIYKLYCTIILCRSSYGVCTFVFLGRIPCSYQNPLLRHPNTLELFQRRRNTTAGKLTITDK